MNSIQRALKGRHMSGGTKPRLDTCGSIGDDNFNAFGPGGEHVCDSEYLYRPDEFKPTNKKGG